MLSKRRTTSRCTCRPRVSVGRPVLAKPGRGKIHARPQVSADPLYGRRQMTRRTCVALLLGVAAVGCPTAPTERSPSYEVYIEPGLVAELPLSVIVPALPSAFGGGRVGGTIRSIEKVALVQGENVPTVDPSLSAEDVDFPVWVVLCRGEFHASLPMSTGTIAATRAVYFIHSKSGFRYSWGILPEASATVEPQ